MPNDPLSPDVRRFVADVIRSVNELELLLLLREHQDRAWTPQEASARLYQSEGWVAGHLEALVVLGLAAREGAHDAPAYRYAPGDERTRRTIDALAEAFARRRTRVIALIYRPEPSSAERFADAFRLRRDDEDDA
ncbi:MAG TPA: hypothetical protein VD931_23355 [Baekduia sp.]|nr:hypothetical protein [Baekduia sp.]